MKYQTIEQARVQDATLYRMMRQNCSHEQIILQLVNEKDSLLQELQELRMKLSPILVLHPDGSMTSKPQIQHIPNIPPNTIQ
jgi:hypothetical protein